ncbi:MAG: hypothetical protein JNM84_07420 [Planctomycetes bacterium]|nr:hypothetical protein [Planctomycetota bacterium]
MVRMRSLLGTAALALLAASADAQLRFTQDFERLAAGSDGSPALQPLQPGWVVENGTYVQSAAEGRYDLVAFFPTYLRGRVLLRTKLAHRAAFAGGGLVFASSSRERLEHATIVRFDGLQELLYGTYRDGVLEPDGRLIVQQPLEPSAWIELQVELDENARRYAVKVNGELVGADLPLRTGSGYAALQASNGRVAFDEVYAEIQRDYDRNVRWPARFALLGESFAYPEPVHGRLVSADREDDGDLHLRTLAPQAEAISALASRRSGGFAALEGAARRVRLFDAQGREESAFSFGGLELAIDLDVDAAGRVHVLAKNGDVLVLDQSGRAIASGFLAPERRSGARFRAIAVRGDGRGLLVDGATPRGIETVLDGEIVRYAGEHALPPDLRDLAFSRTESADEARLYLACGERVEARQLSATKGLGGALESLSGVERRLDAVAIEVAPGGWIGVLDRASQRFLRLPPELSRAEPRWSFESDGSWRATWIAPRPKEELSAELRWTDARGTPRRATPKHVSDGRAQTLSAAELPRGTAVRLELPGACWDEVPARTEGRTLALRTPAPERELHSVRVPVLALVFTDVRHRSQSETLLPEPELLSAAERARIEAELREGAAFYWRNSGARLWLDVTVRFLDEPLLAGALHAGGESEGEPLRAELDSRARALQLELASYSSVIVVSARRAFDSATGTWSLQGRGGASTVGPENRGCGISWWSLPAPSGASFWLFVRELHHQLEALFAAVGHPEYGSPAFRSSIASAARFGEHHDGLAELLRQWPEWKWWALLDLPALSSRRSAFGELAVALDTDGDGLPDEDPRLPLDELRFGSDPLRADSDGDGLSDAAEAQLEIGSALGGAGWSQAVFAARPSPRLRDADGDGIEDARDEEPLYPLTAEIPLAKEAPRIDGAPNDGTSQRLLAVADPRFGLELAAAHRDGNLYLEVRLDRPGRVELLLDGAADGWFVGRENYRLRFEASGGAPTFELAVEGGALPSRWPEGERAGIPLANQLWKAVREEGGATRFELELPSSTATGLHLAAGRSIGLALAVSTPVSEADGIDALSVFEPHRFARFHFVDRPPADAR